MGRTSDGRERLLNAASALFSQRSYSAIGVAEICAVAGVQKGSFYYYFESKQALALAVIEQHWVAQRDAWRGALEAEGSLMERLRRVFLLTTEVQTAALKDAGAVSGCLFGNLALELSAQDDPIRERLQGIFEEQIDLIEEAITTSSEVRPASDAREAAKAVVAQLEGLVLFAKLFNDPAQLDRLWQNSASLLGLHESVG